MTITTLATAEQRRDELIRLAEAVDDGPDPTLALTLLVPPLCAAHVAADPDLALALFEELVGAVAEHRSFTTDESDYAITHDRVPSAEGIAAISERLLGDIDFSVDRLLATATR